MKNHYVLPVCFAAAAHGALLFGFSKGPRVEKIPEFTTVRTIFELRPEIEEVVAEPQPAAAAARPDIERPQPISTPEPVPLDTSTRQTMPLPRIEMSGQKNINVLAEIPIGKPSGKGDGAGWGDITDGINLDNPPRTRFQATPTYPFEAKRGGFSGEVYVEFVVNEQGRVIDPRVVKSTHTMFEEATIRAVAKWQFEPGRREGRIVRFRMTVPVVFNLND